MLYVGMLKDGDTTRMYVSSVSADEEDDQFSKNATLVSFTTPRAKAGDPIAERAELQRLANILTDGGAVVTIES